MVRSIDRGSKKSRFLLITLYILYVLFVYFIVSIPLYITHTHTLKHTHSCTLYFSPHSLLLSLVFQEHVYLIQFQKVPCKKTQAHTTATTVILFDG